MGSSIKKNYIYNVSFQIFSLIIPFITAPYIARVLGPEGVGTYSYANSIATYFSLMAVLGTSSYGLREVSRARDDRRVASRLFWELSIIRNVTTVVCLLLYLAFVLLTRSDLRVYLACGLVILSAGTDASWFYQAYERFKTLTVRNFAVKIAGVILIFLFVRDESDLPLYILIHGGSTLLANVTLRVGLMRSLVRVPLRRLRFRRHIRETMVYFIPTIATSVYTVLDRTMLGAITGDMAQNGFYEQAHKMVNMLMTVVTSLNVVVGVRTSYLFGQQRADEARRHIHHSMRIMFTVAFPLAAGLCACAGTFVPWFYGWDYKHVITLMRLFTPLIILIGISNLLGTLYLTPSGQRARSNRAIIAGAVVNAVLNLLLIPHIGVYGAVVASVAAEAVIALLYLRLSARFVDVRWVFVYGTRYFLLASAMFVPVYALGKVLGDGIATTFIQIAAGIVIYAIELILTRDPMWRAALSGIRRKLRQKGRQAV